MIHIYTDGSCYPNPGPGGWAFVVYDGEPMEAEDYPIFENYASEGDTTNNRMEMISIIEALRWIGDRQCRIFSDSQLCVNTLNIWALGWQKRGWKKADGGAPSNLDLVREAFSLFRLSKAQVRWQRGHVGNIGNERADLLAGLAREGFTSPHTQAPLASAQLSLATR